MFSNGKIVHTFLPIAEFNQLIALFLDVIDTNKNNETDSAEFGFFKQNAVCRLTKSPWRESSGSHALYF